LCAPVLVDRLARFDANLAEADEENKSADAQPSS
jgi:hypothetical protein